MVLPTPSVFEENMLSTLSSFIFFNKVEIVTLIQEDEKFLSELFVQVSTKSVPTKVCFENIGYSLKHDCLLWTIFVKTRILFFPHSQLTDDSTDDRTRNESVRFLKEFCTFSQTLQPQSRETFFKTLNNLGVLHALEITLASENKETKSASTEILNFIVEFSPSMIREYMLQQLNNAEDVSVFKFRLTARN